MADNGSGELVDLFHKFADLLGDASTGDKSGVTKIDPDTDSSDDDKSGKLMGGDDSDKTDAGGPEASGSSTDYYALIKKAAKQMQAQNQLNQQNSQGLTRQIEQQGQLLAPPALPKVSDGGNAKMTDTLNKMLKNFSKHTQSADPSTLSDGVPGASGSFGTNPLVSLTGSASPLDAAVAANPVTAAPLSANALTTVVPSLSGDAAAAAVPAAATTAATGAVTAAAPVAADAAATGAAAAGTTAATGAAAAGAAEAGGAAAAGGGISGLFSALLALL